MGKKILILFLSAIMALSSFATFGCNNASPSSKVSDYATVWSALSTEKYMRSYEENSDNIAKDKMGKTEAKLDFVGMKGETQSMQLMITAKKNIKGIDLEVADLKTANGTTLSASNVKVYGEHYVDIYAPYVNETRKSGQEYYADAGYYPDALIPLDKFQTAREDRVEAGDNQGLWIDIEIPADAVAGDYTATFKLTLADATMDIPVTLKVYNLSMYEEVHNTTLFQIWYQNLSGGEGANYDANTAETYYRYLLEKRINSADPPPAYTTNLATYLTKMPELALNPKVTAYRIPISMLNFDRNIMCPDDSALIPTGIKVSADKQLAEREKLKNGFVNVLTKVLQETVRLRNSGEAKYENIDLLDKLMFYYEDEPTMGYRTDRVVIFCSKLVEAKLEILENPELADLFTANPDLKYSLAKVYEITATNLLGQGYMDVPDEDKDGTPDYVYYDNGTPDDESDDIWLGGNGLTTWCPEEYKWKADGFKQDAEKKQANGETVMWYTCVCNSPIMSYYVETIPISMRMYSWMQYEYGIDGILYWDVVAWASLEDPYKDVIYSTFGGGEGILLYPGGTYGQKEPISSIRLEQLRAGQQDYEYFYMLNEYITANNITTSVQDILAKIGKNFHDGAYTIVDASEQLFESFRIQILDILQDFANDNVAGAQAKINAIMA